MTYVFLSENLSISWLNTVASLPSARNVYIEIFVFSPHEHAVVSYFVSHYIIAAKRVLWNEIVFHGVQKKKRRRIVAKYLRFCRVFFSRSFVPLRPNPSENLIWPMAMLNGSECKNVHIIRTKKKSNNELIWKIDISNSVSVCLLFSVSRVLPPKSILMEVIIRLANKRERERER